MNRSLNPMSAIIYLLLAATGHAEDIPEHRARQIEASAPAAPAAEPKQPRRVLIFITPPHLMPQDPHKGYCIPYGTYAMATLGAKTRAFEPVVSGDVAMFLPENIRQFDAIVLNNASRNWITPTAAQMKTEVFRKHGAGGKEIEQVLRKSLLNYVRQGGGLAAIHYAIGANRHWPEFHQLLGAQYAGHPWHEEVGVKLDEPNHPLLAAFQGKSFRLKEEIYQFRDPYNRDNVRVLLSLDTKTTNMEVPHVSRTDGDFALAWVRPFGKGRVFYTAFGHRTEIYWNPTMLRFYLAGIQFATGDLPAPIEPQGAQKHPPTGAASGPDTQLEKGFVRIFNGRNLDGWQGDSNIWSVRDGAITGQTTKQTGLEFNNFLIWQGGRPKDFELRLKYRLIGGNSGIYFHAVQQPEGEPLIGPQADCSADHRWTGVLMEWKKRDVLAERGQKVKIDASGAKQVIGSLGDPQELLKSVRDQQWNDYSVLAQGNRVELKINGVRMCQLTDNDRRRTPRGLLALQVHKGPPMTVQFKNIRIKMRE